MSEGRNIPANLWNMLEGKLRESERAAFVEYVDWISRNISGDQILDVGATQGFIAAILARHGCCVDTIALSAEERIYLENYLLEELQKTTDRITLLDSDFLELSKNTKKYSSIIIAKQFEDLESLEIYLKKAITLLEEGGQIIATIPYGAGNLRDVKKKYYLSGLMVQFLEFARIKHISFFSNWVGCIVTPKKTVDASEHNHQLFVERIEREEQALADQINALHTQIHDMQEISQKNNQIAYENRRHLENQLKVQEEQYTQLATSFFGRIQLRIWKNRTKRKYRAPLLVRLEAFAKKFPLLVSMVRFLRGQKKEAAQALKKPKIVAAKVEGPLIAPDMGYYDRLKPMVEQMPQSNGSRYYEKLKPTIGWITDQILYDAFKSATDGILLTPENWNERLDRIDWLFIISGWHGMTNEWNGFAREGSPKRKIIYQIIDTCKQRKIPTVFYSVEDPPNYERFIGIAKRVDHVFTACQEIIPRYREDCGHDRIHQMCYGLDPLLHNPIGFRKFAKQPEVFFAGSWMEKYPERGKDMQVLFDGVLQAGRKLKIVDRNLLLNKDEYRFPNKYSAYLAPPLEHSLLQRVHKLYDWAININSVKDSATMFANRTYELQGMGVLMISNYSVGVNSLLPGIFTCQHAEEIPDILNCLTPEEVYEHQVMGIRLAMNGNTCYERVAEILNTVGIETSLPQYKVAVVVQEENAALAEAFEHQTYKYREMIFPQMLLERYKEFDLVAFFHPSYTYGDFYLEDMINGFKYTNSDYITKAGYYKGKNYVHGIEHDFVNVMDDKFRTVFWASAFAPKQLLDFEGSVALENGYSIDHFMFNAGQLEKDAEPEHYDITVVVPVYNNGPHLYGKAFNSLRRSSLFNTMEILLIDDGSTDVHTTAIVRSLEKQYPNVKAYFFGDGGSGSASRPRNKGVELASAEYITFLDPDNEAVNDAYSKMLKIAIEEKQDIVVGNMIRFRLKEELANYSYYIKKYCGKDRIIGDKGEFLKKMLFMPMSIQAMVIRKEIITKSKISQVVGAVGQDSFFSWQLFMSAERICSISLPAHIYYAMVQNSTVNTVSKKYFERSLLQEVVQRDWLVENDLIDAYMQLRFSVFFRDWYMKKMEQAKPGHEQACAELLWDIFKLYEKWYDGKDPTINTFIKKMRNSADAQY